MRRKSRKRSGLKATVSVILILIIFFAGYYMGNQLTKTVIVYETNRNPANIVTYVPYIGEKGSYASISVPAVDENGEGLTTILSVQIVPGSGRILANIDKMLFWTDTQNSIRTSTKVASNLTGTNLSKYDIVYTIETDATAVEGPSAGAALVIVTIAALEGKTLNPEVTITGAVNHDGTIGSVGEILPKAKAAKESGAEIFLVPLLHSREVTYKKNKYCEQIGPSEICTTENIPVEVSISEEAGIEVIEIRTIQEALEYFFD